MKFHETHECTISQLTHEVQDITERLSQLGLRIFYHDLTANTISLPRVSGPQRVLLRDIFLHDSTSNWLEIPMSDEDGV